MTDCSKGHVKGCNHRIQPERPEPTWPEWKPSALRSPTQTFAYKAGYFVGLVLTVAVVVLILMLALTGAVLIVEDIVLPALRGA